MTTVVGLDLSLTATGIARVGWQENHSGSVGPAAVQLARIGEKGKATASLSERSLRLRKTAGQITQQCAGASLVVVEGPTYSHAEAGTWDRAGLWWLVVARLTGAGITVVEADPTAVKTYALGKGAGAGTGKDEVLAAVIRRYLPVVEVPGNNEADALVLAAMAARFLRRPIEPGGMLPATHTRALDRVRWAT